MRKYLLLLSLLFLYSRLGFALEIDAWTTHVSNKIRPSAEKDDGVSAIAKHARNEYASFQVGITATAEQYTDLDVTAEIDGITSITVYKEENINVITTSGDYGDTGEWPEILYPKVDDFYGETRNTFPFSFSNISRAYQLIAAQPRFSTCSTTTTPACGSTYSCRDGLAYGNKTPPSGYTYPYTCGNPVLKWRDGWSYNWNRGIGEVSTSGIYTGEEWARYIVVIESSGEVGEATFKWSDDNGATFTTGVTTAADVELNNGVHVSFAEKNLTVSTVVKGNPTRVVTANEITSADNTANGSVDSVRTFTFNNVGGMTELNGNTYKIKKAYQNNYYLYDMSGNPINSTNYGTYTSGGTIDMVDFIADDEWIFYVSSSRNVMIWIDAYIPHDATPGIYDGTITITATGRETKEIPISLTVYDFTIPETSSLKNFFGPNNGNCAQGHGLYTSSKIDNLYVASGLRHRVSMPNNIVDSRSTDMGGSCSSYNENTEEITMNFSTLEPGQTGTEFWYGTGTTIDPPGIKFPGKLTTIEMARLYMSNGSCSYNNGIKFTKNKRKALWEFLVSKGLDSVGRVYYMDEPGVTEHGMLVERAKQWDLVSTEIPLWACTLVNNWRNTRTYDISAFTGLIGTWGASVTTDGGSSTGKSYGIQLTDRITNITNANPMVVTVQESWHGFNDGETVYFDNVGGMTELNGNSYLVDTSGNLGNSRFRVTDSNNNLIDSTSYGAYTSGGFVGFRKFTLQTLTGSFDEGDVVTDGTNSVTLAGSDPDTMLNYIDIFVQEAAFQELPYTPYWDAYMCYNSATCEDTRSNISSYASWLAEDNDVTREVGSYSTCIAGGGCYQQGGEFFSGFNNYELDGPSLASRTKMWFIRNFGYTMEYYFSSCTNHFKYNTGGVNPLETSYQYGKNGDGTMFYPGRPERIGGTNHIPLESIRLKQIRLGMQDYEYFKILDDLGKNDFVDSETSKIIFDSVSYETDVDVFEASREAIANEILGSLGIINVVVSPSSVSLSTLQTQDFDATVYGTANQSVTWSLEGDTCPSCGTITQDGLYTVPNEEPYEQTITIKAISDEDGISYGTATAVVSIPPTPEPPTSGEKIKNLGSKQQFKGFGNKGNLKNFQ